MYKKYADETETNKDGIQINSSSSYLRKSDNAYIPFDEANIDYQEYLAWVAEDHTRS